MTTEYLRNKFIVIIKESGASGAGMKMNKRNKSLLLKVDKNFTPAVVENGEEYYPNGIFVFNITKMLGFINSNKEKFNISDISVREYRSSMAILNEDHIDSVDIENPVILAEISPGRHNVIDGRHRVERAYRLGKDTIPGYILAPWQHMQFLITVEAYHAFVKYWNDKVKEIQE